MHTSTYTVSSFDLFHVIAVVGDRSGPHLQPTLFDRQRQVPRINPSMEAEQVEGEYKALQVATRVPAFSLSLRDHDIHFLAFVSL